MESPERTILFYGHLDKQPPMEGWMEGFGPYEPKIHEGNLYGRGGADDGYAGFACTIAIKACQEILKKHSRCVICLETGEESGSEDFIELLPELKENIPGNVELVVIADSDCNDFGRI